MNTGKKRVRMRIEGRVQGVYFRATAQREAEALGVTGFVRNLPDGAVEALAEGEETAVDRLVEWCRHGPPGARVTRVVCEAGTYTGEFAGFRVAG